MTSTKERKTKTTCSMQWAAGEIGGHYSNERDGDIMYTSCLLKEGRRSTSIRKSSLKKRKATMEKR